MAVFASLELFKYLRRKPVNTYLVCETFIASRGHRVRIPFFFVKAKSKNDVAKKFGIEVKENGRRILLGKYHLNRQVAIELDIEQVKEAFSEKDLLDRLEKQSSGLVKRLFQ